MSNQLPNNNSSGCSGCLGNLFSIAILGAILFGLVRCSVSIGGFNFGINAGRQQPNVIDLTDIEMKTKVSEAAIGQFHTQLFQGECQNIYEQANEKFKQKITQADFLKGCEKANLKLGTIKSSQKVSSDWQPAEQDSSKYIRLQYNTNFANVGAAKETFIWLVNGSKPELVFYDLKPVNSEPSI